MLFLHHADARFLHGLNLHGFPAEHGLRLLNTGFITTPFGQRWSGSPLLASARTSERPYYIDRITFGMPESYDYNMLCLPIVMLAVWDRRDPWPIQIAYAFAMLGFLPLFPPPAKWVLATFAAKFTGLLVAGVVADQLVHSTPGRFAGYYRSSADRLHPSARRAMLRHGGDSCRFSPAPPRFGSLIRSRSS